MEVLNKRYVKGEELKDFSGPAGSDVNTEISWGKVCVNSGSC